MTEQSPARPVHERRAARLIRLKEVRHRVGLGRSTIYRWMAEEKFPKPVQLGGYAVAWLEEDIDRWIVERLAPDSHSLEARGSRSAEGRR